MLLAQLSDPHVNEHDPEAAAALRRAVRAVLQLSPAPDAVLVSGDLAEHGSATEYRRVKELLAPLRAPVLALPGNHDDAEALRAALGADDDVRCAGYRLVLCDTHIPGRADGRLDVERLAARLATDPATPTLVALHHSPLLTGIDALDAIGLPAEDRSALAQVLAGAPQVRRVVGGHVHRSAATTLGGCCIVASGSTYMQARLDLAGDALELVPEPPVYALHFDVAGELVSHVVAINSRR
jgi:3',5'-cyclic AMP phosphodiesterase CpdA